MTASFGPAGPNRWSVRLSRRYPHPVEKVWQAISRSEHLAAWFPSTVTFLGGDPPEVGSEVHFGEPADGSPAGVVTDCDPPHLLAFTWDTDHLRFELSPVADGTELVLLHRFDDRAGAASFASGWEVCFAALGAGLNGEPDPEPSRAERRHEELVVAFGLGAPVVDDVDEAGRWRIVFERQLVAPAEAVWELLLRHDPVAGHRLPAPAVGDPFPRDTGAEHVLGTLTEVVPGQLLAWECAPDQPGDTVHLALIEGTGHGARLVVTITGSVPTDRETARDRWHASVAGTAAETLDRALSVAPG